MNNESEMVANIECNDITLIESNCDYEKTCSIMKEENISTGKWMLETNATIICYYENNGQKNIVSEAQTKLQFYNDGLVKIISYLTMSADPMFSPDIRSLKSYIIEKGWKKIEPHIYLVDENLILWRNLWETGIVDSDYLEKRFGPREFFEESEGEKSDE